MQQDAAYGRGNQEKSAQPLLKVLVIEDEDNIVELIKLGLRYEGFQVEAASDGPEGISAAQRINPDMVILDLGLQPGGMDGLEVCRRLRTNPTTQDVPILMLTARDEPRDKVLGLETGADDYLTKPPSPDPNSTWRRICPKRLKRACQKSHRSRTRCPPESVRDMIYLVFIEPGVVALSQAYVGN